MPSSPLGVVIRRLLADLGPDEGGPTDGELLARFLASRDEDALATLVRRHAAMVWGVCRRHLNHHDAEDAFQATFLVLVRKAANVPRQAVANWLYGVARQTAVRLRATAAKRGRRESQVVNMPDAIVAEAREADLQAVVDEEVSRLPDHYRGVVVLCDLEGRTRKEAARHLGIPEGSVASRLARARALLGKRLTRRRVVFSGGAVAAGSASALAPPALVASTVNAASKLAAGRAVGVISAQVAALTSGVVKGMFMTKIKGVLGVGLAVGLALGGVGVGGGLPTSRVAVAQPPAAKPDGADWRIRVLDEQITRLRRQQQQADQEAARQEERSAAIERTLGDLLAQRERFLATQKPAAKGGSDGRLPMNPAAVAPEQTGDQSLDGLWEDVENEGGWLRFDGSTIKYHPAGKSEERWTCRYNLTPTPMTIDIFRNNRTDHGIFVVERGTLFIALATPGNERPTRFRRDEATTLYVLKRKKPDESSPVTTAESVGKGAMPRMVSGQLIVHGILERVDAKQSVVTAKAVVGNDASSVMRLLALVADKKPAEGGTADALLKEIGPDHYPKLVNVPVRADADGGIGIGVGVARKKLKMEDLRAGQVVMLQLAADRRAGLVVVFVRVMSEGKP